MMAEYYPIKAREHAVMRKLKRLAAVADPNQLFTEDNFALYMCDQKTIYADRQEEQTTLTSAVNVFEEIKTMQTKNFKE